MFLTLALDVFMVVFRVIHLDADLQCRSGWKAQQEPWLGLGSVTLLLRLAHWRAGRREGSISFLSMGVRAELCRPPGGARQV